MRSTFGGLRSFVRVLSLLPLAVALAIGALALRDANSAANAPANLGAVKTPPDNPQSAPKVALGHQLFFDKRLSVDGSRSCYSCHKNEDGNGGHDPLAIGPGDKVLTRHSPVIWNVGYLPELYWDGRSKSLEDQATAAWAGGNMGVGKENLEKKAAEIAAIKEYKEQFEVSFPGEPVSASTIVKALSAYERTLICDKTAYDKHAGGDATALSDEQKKGLDLFMGKAACVVCHTPPHFSSAYGGASGIYYNVGIGTQGKKDEEVDIGRAKVTGAESDWAAFKVPSLRKVPKSAPYFHDGSVKTLDEAVRVMAGGGVPNKHLSSLLVDRKLSDAEIKQIVAFLGALDCNDSIQEPKLPE